MSISVNLFLPELFQIVLVLMLFFQSISKSQVLRNDGFWVPVAAAIGIGVSVASLSAEGMLFHNAYKIDMLSQFFKLAIAVGFFIATLNARQQSTLDANKETDYFLFLAFSAMGLQFLSSSVELITIFVALEISSYALYAVIPVRARDKQAAEAGIKYILFGAVATAVSLYGLSFILSSQHTSYLSMLSGLDWHFATNPMAVIGLSMFLAGMFYKLALFPFHFWCPDVYQGASNETAAYVATLPKLGAVVVLIRLAAILTPHTEVTMIFAVLGAASMTFGNLSALVQRDVKRILGFSSVSHAGYVMLGLVAGTPKGLAAAAFYSLVYILMNLTCFWVICKISPKGENVTLDDLDGLYKRSPYMALILAVSAFALVGLPPTAGFIGKLFLLTSAWDHGYNWFVIVAAVNTAIAIYYYLGLVRHAYTVEPVDKRQLEPMDVGGMNVVWGTVLAAVILLLGAIPAPVFSLAKAAGVQLLP
ncbi:NADH-quinone oxidoreductase subunit N [Desulfovibrio ferrophilus]|uniref:NADH-quinone oxidoreductase subunit N n=1 Tax=Desulfovibrio ferrophilus TaxID=241368 RepID=A0A2Z6AUK4_9BACT|nr:NADH-quinone oxidoreductase subunit N [Desulfovibrio ferrophilus]BBD06875.1 NADH-quinone oxidoreductase subunit N 2 [Desulfovibrio ferrophilus]